MPRKLGPPKPSEKSQRAVERAEDQARVLRLIAAGMTFRDCGRILECSHEYARKLYVEARALIGERAREEFIDEIATRQRALIKAHWPSKKHHESAKVIQGSDKLLMSLLGLEAPKRTEHTGKDGGPIVSFDVSKLTDAQLDRVLAGDLSGLADGAGGARGDERGDPASLESGGVDGEETPES